MISLTLEDKRLLEDLCEQQNLNYEKVIKLLETVQEYEFKDRRRGIYDALREIITTDINEGVQDG